MKLFILIFIFLFGFNLYSQNGIYKITNLNDKYETPLYILYYNNETYELKDDIKINSIKSYNIHYNVSGFKLKAEVFLNLIIERDNISSIIDFDNQFIKINNAFLKEDYQINELILESKKNKNKIKNNKFQSASYSLEYSSYFSDGRFDQLRAITEDKSGNIYFGGESDINKFPFNRYIGNRQGGISQLIIKTNKDMEVIWINLIGGSDKESILDLTVDKDNNIWGVGEAQSNDYPIVGNSFQKNNYGGGDGCIFCLNQEGQLIFSSFYGTGSYEALTCIETKDDYIYTAGQTGESSGYFVIFHKNGTKIYEGIVDTPGVDSSEDIAVDSTGNLYLTGWISSNLNVNSINKHNGGYDSYVLKFNINKLEFEKIIYIGGTAKEQSFNIELDNNGNIYLAGVTTSSNFQSKLFNDTFKGDQDLFLTKIDSEFNIIWSRIIGGKDVEGVKSNDSNQGGLSVNDDFIYISSQTKSRDFELKNSIINDFKSGYELLIQKYDVSGNLLFSTILNGNGDDYCRAIYADNSSIYFAGITTSEDFITTENAIKSKPENSFYKAIFGKLSLTNNTIPDKPCETNFFDYRGFHDKKGLILTQDAVTYDSTLRLTKETFYQKGAVWVEYPIEITKGFETEFSFELSNGNDYNNPDGSMPGADGIALIIQANKPDVIGYSGGGIGYEGIENAFVIELDLFQNDESGFSDPNGNHIAIFSSKNKISANHQSNDLVYQNTAIDEIYNDKTRYNFKVIYDDERRTFEVFLNEKGQTEKRVAFLENFDFIDHINLIDNDFAFLGISAATGNSVQRHELKSWSFCGGEKLLSINKNIDDIIYPNPVKDNVILNERFLADEIQVFDLYGKRCDFEVLGNSINLIHLNKGVYFIRVFQNNIIYTQKFIKE